ncbi:MAG TPA: class 1 fructose-bisphosphatase [Burkholderiales bacterium]|nr:class 1 fructose-bisphosphatase [Burkholderiales bacterium]
MDSHAKTITEFIIGEQRKSPGATGGFSALLNDIRIACKRIGNVIGKGALAGISDGELRRAANETFLRTNEWGGHLAALASEAHAGLHHIPTAYPRGRYLLAFDPLCGASGLEVNAVAGSLFSVLRAAEGAQPPEEKDFLQPGARQVCAGYAIYGPTMMLVLALESGVNGFTLDREIGEFMLTHPAIGVPQDTSEFAIDSSNARFWEPAVKRYVDECLAGRSGPRGKDFRMRWAASLVADAHRILLHGGVFLSPRESSEPQRAGRHELLFEANPLAFLMERAGGRASTGEGALLEVAPADLHQRTPLIFGSRTEVERLERYHRDYNEREYDAPLFGSRGLFRARAEA